MADHQARNAFLAGVAEGVLSAAQSKGLTLRVMGGLGIYLGCPEFRGFLDKYRAPLSDIDLVGLSREISGAENLLESLGYEQNRRWKTLFGYQRRIFYTPKDITIEIYLDRLHLCQTIDLRSRMGVSERSIAPTDLFLSRIQRVKLEPKDILDLSVLLIAKGPGANSSQTIDIDHIASLSSKSWAWWKTIYDNLNFMLSSMPSALGPEPLQSRLRLLQGAISKKPRSIGWHVRALVGTRIQWYNDVD